MTIIEILTKIDLAISTLISNDLYLLERELSEKNISFKLAEYLQPLFNGFNGSENSQHKCQTRSIRPFS